MFCGEPLQNENQSDSWQKELSSQEKPKSYININEDGEESTSVDDRERLAYEMANLNVRKRSGELKQQQFKEKVANNEFFSPAVKTTSNRATFFSSEIKEEHSSDNVYQSATKPVMGSNSILSKKSKNEYENNNYLDNNSNANVYDGFRDTSAYFPLYADKDKFEHTSRIPEKSNYKEKKAKKRTRILLVFIVILAILAIAFGVLYFTTELMNPKQQKNDEQVTITPTIRNDLSAHTITIPGEEGQRITLLEMRTSAIVIGGVATFDILDHMWYDEDLSYLQETMTVTLTPYAVSETGLQKALPKISYDINIPLSTIDLDTPDKYYEVVSTALYNVSFYVQPGSTVLINGDDYSDLVNSEDGKVSYNATIQPIGENKIDIVVRSQYCRENSVSLVLFREKQDIPLDLASDIATESSNKSASMEVKAVTLPGAYVQVLTPHTDLDITNVPVDGTFSFRAKFENYGNNSIIIAVDYPGKKQTTVEHKVYYVPNQDVYTRVAWSAKNGYTDLIDNIKARASNSQIYLITGKIESIESNKPQRAYINVGTEAVPQLIYIENASRTQWEIGKEYDLYGDAFGTYNSKPWLIVRYTY